MLVSHVQRLSMGLTVCTHPIGLVPRAPDNGCTFLTASRLTPSAFLISRFLYLCVIISAPNYEKAIPSEFLSGTWATRVDTQKRYQLRYWLLLEPQCYLEARAKSISHAFVLKISWTLQLAWWAADETHSNLTWQSWLSQTSYLQAWF